MENSNLLKKYCKVFVDDLYINNVIGIKTRKKILEYQLGEDYKENRFEIKQLKAVRDQIIHQPE